MTEEPKNPTPSPTEPPADPQQPPSIISEDLTFADNWRERLPEDLRADRTLAEVRDLAGLARSYANAQKLIGKKTINAIPGEDATPEEIQKFRQALGVPEKPEDYQLEKPADLPEGMEYDENLQAEFAQKAHEAGIPPKQAQQLLDWFNEKGKETFENVGQSRQQAVEQAEAELKKEWGQAYKQNLTLANRAVEKFGAADALADAGLDNDPKMARVFLNIAKAMGEDNAIQTPKGGGELSPADAKAKIAEIQGNKKDPYFDGQHPQHQQRVDEMARLFEQAYPSPAE